MGRYAGLKEFKRQYGILMNKERRKEGKAAANAKRRRQVAARKTKSR
jgi:hypothetical protein